MLLKISGADGQRLVNLHPSFFAPDNEESPAKRAQTFAHETMSKVSDVVLLKGNNIFYEKHYPVANQKLTPARKQPAELKKIMRKEHKNSSFKKRMILTY